MDLQTTLFPLEFLVAETPKSLQASARSKSNWRATIKQAAQMRIEATVGWEFLDTRRLSVTIFYFAPSRMEGDIDNIVKPILDGMINVAYYDDQAIERVMVQKFEAGIDRAFTSLTGMLQAALVAAPPVVYVRVDDDLKWRSL